MEMAQNEKKKIVKWINCAKCVAILAVLIDHTPNDLTGQKMEWAS